MPQAVMQIGQGRLQGYGGAVLFDSFPIISLCRLKVAHQLMQAMRVGVCLVEPEISRGGQFFVATRAPVGCFSRIPIRCRQFLKSFESSFVLACFQQGARHANAKFSGGPRSENPPCAWSDLREPPALEREVDVCFGAAAAGHVLTGGGGCKGSLHRCFGEVPVLFSKKRQSQVRCWGVPIFEVSGESLDFFECGVGELFESGLAEPCFVKAQEPLRLLHVNGNRFLPILKRGAHIFLDQPCFTATNRGTQAARSAPHLLVKFPNCLVYFSRAQKNFTQLRVQSGAVRGSREGILKMNHRGGPLVAGGVTLRQ